MTAENFVYWLQGWFELNDANGASPVDKLGTDQVVMIRRHLALVFVHDIDPKAGGPEKQKELNKIHNPVDVKLPLHKGSGMRC